MNKSQERKESKKNKIISTCIKLYLENGYKNTTMDNVAYHANVSKVTIYKYFGDKESFNLYLLSEIISKYKTKIQESSKQANNLTSEMIYITEVMIEFIGSGRSELCDELLRVTSYNENDLREYEKGTLINLIEIGQKRKIIKEDLDLEVLYHYIDMGLSYYKYNIEYRKKVQSDSVFRQAYMSLIWDNIFKDRSAFKT